MTRHRTIDLNADMGESFGRWTLGDDAGLLKVVTSANVACGFHAGDAATLVTTCRGAVRHGVAIGAQVGYGDLAGFGRRFLDIEPEALYADVLYRIGALDGIARAVGGAVAYVKPHGALYNAVVHHAEQAAAVVAAVADRAYTPAGTLVSRREPGAVLHDPQAVAERVVRLVAEGRITAVDGRRWSSRPSRSASTATAPGRWRWPAKSGVHSRRPGSP